MGLFFGGYDKAGPGVDPNAPKKKGFFLYMELVTRKFTKFCRRDLYFRYSACRFWRLYI